MCENAMRTLRNFARNCSSDSTDGFLVQILQAGICSTQRAVHHASVRASSTILTTNSSRLRSFAPWQSAGPSSSATASSSMPPKKQQAGGWGEEQKAAIIACFKDTTLEPRWDPSETSGPKIRAFLKAAPLAMLALIQPHFSVNDGGTKANNNTLYQHYKDIGCEFIVEQTRAGIRRADAEYIDNNNLSGARRKRSSEESASSNSSGSITLGSEDTPPKMSSKNKPLTPAAKETPAKSSGSSGKTGDSEVDALTSRMKGLQLSKSRDWGFCFTGPLPYFWWSYNYGGVRHLKMEILMGHTPWHEDIVPTVSESGDYLIVYCKLPDYFLNVGRLFGYYHHEVNDAPTFQESDAMFVGGVEASREIKALLETNGGARAPTCIKLPFKVLHNFIVVPSGWAEHWLWLALLPP